MKLKAAEKQARKIFELKRGVYFVSVDKSKSIYLYRYDRPCKRGGAWWSSSDDSYAGGFASEYTGKKHWTKAIRRFEV